MKHVNILILTAQLSVVYIYFGDNLLGYNKTWLQGAIYLK